MAKSRSFAALVILALCFNLALASHSLYVHGHVYCDICRVEFETKISLNIPGTKVRLECKNRGNNTVTYQVEGVTDESGRYRLGVDGDHEEEICEVKLIESGMADCTEPFKTVDQARVLLTKNVGVVQPIRYANPLGYMKKQASPKCGKVLQDMGFLPLEIES